MTLSGHYRLFSILISPFHSILKTSLETLYFSLTCKAVVSLYGILHNFDPSLYVLWTWDNKTRQ